MTYWISCKKFTVEVETNPHGIVTHAAPIVRKFQGQPLNKLLDWARDFGGLRYHLLNEAKP